MEKTMETMSALTVKDITTGIVYRPKKDLTTVMLGNDLVGILNSSESLVVTGSNYEIVITDFIPTSKGGVELVGTESTYVVDMEERTITNPDGMTLLIPHTDGMTLYDLVHLLELFDK